MAISTVTLTATFYKQDGTPYEGVVLSATMRGIDVQSQQYVSYDTDTTTSNASGVATLQLFPNSEGTRSSYYLVTAVGVNGEVISSSNVSIPNSACNLADVEGNWSGEVFSGGTNATVTGNLTVLGNTTLSNTTATLTGGSITGVPISGAAGSFTSVTSSGAVSGTNINASGTLQCNGNATLGDGPGDTHTVNGTINGTTIPSSKTLVTLDDTQTLTNKTLTAPAINGTVTTTGLTLPALTLSGNVGSSGNPSLNLGTGALTAGSGTFSGAVKSTGANLVNEATAIKISQEAAATSRISAYGNDASTQGTLQIRTVSSDGSASTIPATFSSTGLSVAGAVSATDNVTIKKTGGLIEFRQTDNSRTGYIQETSGNLAIVGERAGSSLQLYSNNTLNATLDASGNLGLGVTPSASWPSGTRAFQFGPSSALYNPGSGSRAILASNAIFTIGASSATYITSNAAAFYDQDNGTHKWNIAPSGTAGNAISFTQAMTLNASGNLGLGVTPKAWSSSTAVDVGNVAALTTNNTLGSAEIVYNAYQSSASGYTYKYGGLASLQRQVDGAHQWFTAPSGTAGNAITFTQAMTLDASGNLLVGPTSGTTNIIQKRGGSEGQLILAVDDNVVPGLRIYQVANSGYNGAATGLNVGKNSSTNRSINTAGTINASGADYAEYERNNGLTITKGSIVGFKSDGTLTLTFSEAVRFGIKSTNPSYVGGDTWGSEDVVGKRPEKAEDQTDEEFAPLLAAWEATLEAERQKVDRIAYSGKVPVNVTGATAGGYIIASQATDGSITGYSTADPDFAEYKRAVGRVNRILEDGRAEVAVMVH